MAQTDFRHTKIIATVGPSCHDKETLKALVEKGVNVFRLNFSHGKHEDHAKSVRNIRLIEKEANHPIAILADLQGPKLRLGTIEKPYEISTGDVLILCSKPSDQKNCVHFPHQELYGTIPTGAILLIDDGKVKITVEESTSNTLMCRVNRGGVLSSNKGVNIINTYVPIDALTEKDKQDIEFIKTLDIDWLALSFVQKPKDIHQLRSLVPNHFKIISKIEKPLALQHLEQIISLSDAIMIARGDLGVEISPEEVPSIQKEIIRECRSIGKPVVVATQMLESMIQNPIPTRAEASDIASAVYDGVDAVMLSGETANGHHPVDAVRTMRKIIEKVENDTHYHSNVMGIFTPPPVVTVTDSIALAAKEVTTSLNIPCIVTFTESGRTALRMSRFRPNGYLMMLTPSEKTARFMSLVWGVQCFIAPSVKSFDEMIERACDMVKTTELAHIGDNVIVIAGSPFSKGGSTNLLKIIEIC